MADAVFEVEVTSTATGLDQTSAQLDAVNTKLGVAGASAENYGTAIARMSRDLESARAASTAANATLAEGSQEFAQLEKAADKAAKAQERAALRGAVPPEVAASVAATSAALEAHTAKLQGLEHAAKAAASTETALGATLANTKKLAAATAQTGEAAGLSEGQIRKLKGALPGLGGALGQVGGKVAGFADDFGDLSEAFGSSGAAAIAAVGAVTAVAAAVVVVTAAVIAGTIAVAAWGVGLADVNRSAALTTQAVEAMNPQLAALHDTIGGVGDQTGLTTAAIDGIAQSLIDAKVSAADLPDALRAAALEERALGQGGAQKFVADLKLSKKAVGELAAETQAKLGGIVAKQMLSVTAQTDKFKSNIGQLFGGLNIDPVLTGLSKLVALFDENTAAGQAMKFLFEKVFQPLIDQADKAATVVEAFVLGFLIGLTKLYIAAKPTIKAISEFLGFNDSSLSDTLAAVTKAGEYLVPAFAVAAGLFVALAAAIGIAVAAVVGIQIAIYSLYAAVAYAAVAVVGGFIDAWHAVTAYLDSITLEGVGTAIMQGLANGILGAGGAVLSAIGGVVAGAIDSAHDLLKINSPSKVFMAIGGSVGEGFAGGINDSTPEAQDAVSNLVAAPSASAAPAGKGSSGSGSGITINEGAVQISIQGVQGAAEAKTEIRSALFEVLEQFAAQCGGATPAT